MSTRDRYRTFELKQTIRQDTRYTEMKKNKPSDTAIKHFKRKPYEQQKGQQ